MRDILKELSKISDVDFEKCGEIILASKKNVYALCCFHCHDIFMKIKEFIQHLHETHKDVINFEDEEEESFRNTGVNSYSVEELLGEDEKEPWNESENLWNNSMGSPAAKKEQQENKFHKNLSVLESTNLNVQDNDNRKNVGRTVLKDYNVSLDLADILNRSNGEKENVASEPSDTVDLSKLLLKQLNENENLNCINLDYLRKLTNNKVIEKVTYTTLNKTSAKINLKPIAKNTLTVRIRQQSKKQGDVISDDIVLENIYVEEEQVNDEESEVCKDVIFGEEDRIDSSSGFEENEIYTKNLSGDKENVQCKNVLKNTPLNLNKTENENDESYLHYLESIIMNGATPPNQENQISKIYEVQGGLKKNSESDKSLSSIANNLKSYPITVKNPKVVVLDRPLVSTNNNDSIVKNNIKIVLKRQQAYPGWFKISSDENIKNTTEIQNCMQSYVDATLSEEKTPNNVALKRQRESPELATTTFQGSRQTPKTKVTNKTPANIETFPIITNPKHYFKRRRKSVEITTVTTKTRGTLATAKNNKILNRLERPDSPKFSAAIAKDKMKTQTTNKNKRHNFTETIHANRMKNDNYLSALMENIDTTTEKEKKELTVEQSAAKKSKPHSDKTATHVTLGAGVNDDKPNLKNNNTNNETNTIFTKLLAKETASVQNIDIKMIAESPIKEAPNFKQNFNENNALLEKKLLPKSRKNSEKSGDTSIPRPRKASIDVLQQTANDTNRKTPLRRNSDVLDYKSYTLNRSTRKIEVLERMRSIKKQIFKTIGKENTNKPNIVMKSIIEKTDDAIIPGKKQKLEITNVKTLPALNIKKERLTPLLPLVKEGINQLPKNVRDYESSVGNILNALKIDKTIVKLNKTKSKVQITNGETLAKLEQLTPSLAVESNTLSINSHKKFKIEQISPLVNSNISFKTSAVELPSCSQTVNSKKQSAKILKEERSTPSSIAIRKTKTEINTPINSTENIVKRTKIMTRSIKNNRQTEIVTKTPKTSNISTVMPPKFKSEAKTMPPLSLPSGLKNSIPQNCENEKLSPFTNTENTSPILSNSALEYLQHDLKSNKLDISQLGNTILKEITNDGDKENILLNDILTESNNISIEFNIFEDLLSQVDNEQSLNENSISCDLVDKRNLIEELKNQTEDADISKAANTELENDLDLLDRIGLQIIKIPSLENNMPFEQLKLIHTKAKKFSKLFENFNYIWQAKTTEPHEKINEKVNFAFTLLTQELNTTFSEKFTTKDSKRIVNLVSIWYTTSCKAKLLNKKKLEESTKFYIHLFSFLPRTIRRSFYCEYCEKQFRAESKYIIHRIEHTGALPYICKYCNRGYKTERSIKAHELSCKNLQKRETCNICDKQFPSLQELNEHNREMHEHRVAYKCRKC